MNFYMLEYTEQYFEEDFDMWKNSCYDHQNLLVIASSLDEAKEKLSKLINNIGDNVRSRAVPNREVVKCDGLNLQHGYDSFYVTPIFEEDDKC